MATYLRLKPYNLQNRGFSRMTRISRIIDFGIDKLFFSITERFSVQLTVFDDCFVCLIEIYTVPKFSTSSNFSESGPIRFLSFSAKLSSRRIKLIAILS